MRTSNGILLVILLTVLIVGGLYVYKQENTTTIELPGDNKIEVQH